MKLRSFALYSFLVALLLAGTLLIAAASKIIYPDIHLKYLNFCVVSFEVLFAIVLLLFFRNKVTWLLSAQVLALWMGVAFFWYRHDLPCGCFGNLDTMPKGLTFIFDAVFYLLSLTLARRLGARGKLFWISCALSLGLMVVGYYFGAWIYDCIFVQQRSL